MNFGKGILIGFILFAIFITTLAVLCMMEEVGLVSKTYYNDELHFSEVMEKRDNTAKLPYKPSIKTEEGKLRVTFRDWNKISEGEVKLVRPSDSHLDEIFPVQPTSDSVQVFQLKKWKTGLYHFRMTWTMESKNYLFEEHLLL